MPASASLAALASSAAASLALAGALDLRRLLAPEIQRPAEARLGIAHPLPGTAERLWDKDSHC